MNQVYDKMRTNKLPKKESLNTEFKVSFDLELVETLTAFANSDGGNVFLGISDNGAVKGVSAGPESAPSWINQIKNSTTPQIIPDITFVSIHDKTVAVFSISQFPIRPVACKGRYLKRIGNSNQQMPPAEVADMHLRTFNTSWDSYPDASHTIEQISLNKVSHFISRINKLGNYSLSKSPKDVLKKFELIKGKHPTFAAFLMFMKDENAISTIELGRFQTETIIKDSARFKTDIFTEVDGVMDFILKHINKRIIITGQPVHSEVWDYPVDALREIVLNAIIHRDYMQSADTVIKIFDHKIEFFNPGKLPAGITVKKLISGDYVSKPRNKKIAEAFKEVGLIEKYGSGIRRIIDAFRQHGSKEPVFEEIADTTFNICYNCK